MKSAAVDSLLLVGRPRNTEEQHEPIRLPGLKSGPSFAVSGACFRSVVSD